MEKKLDFSIVESKSLDFSTIGVIYLGLSTVEFESLDFSLENCDVKKFTLIPQTISIWYPIKKIIDFSIVESKSIDESAVGFTYLALSTVKSESLDFSIEKSDD